MNASTYAIYAKDLANLLHGEVSIENKEREGKARDTSIFYLKPEIVIYPKNEGDIGQTLKYVANAKTRDPSISVTFRSAGTCMTGGPLSNSIVVDVTRHMNHIFHVDDNQATAESGVFYRDFEKETLKRGWLLPSYPASRELAAMGGIVSNNSGGEKTLTYGKTEKYVKSLRVVYANGEADTIIPLSGEALTKKLEEQTESGRIHREMYELVTKHYDEIKEAKPDVSKNSSGYYLWNIYDKETRVFDLTKVIVGSQGTLACVTAATISGIKPKNHSKMLVMFLPTTSHLGEIVPKLLKHKPETLESYDDHTFKIGMKFFGDIALRMGKNMFSLVFQFLPEFWMAVSGGIPKIILLAEFTGKSEQDVTSQIMAAYKDMQSFGVPVKYTSTEDEARKYWTFRRESFNLLRSRMRGYRTAPTIDDIIVHPKDLPKFLPELEKIFSKYDLIYTIAGHMGDANFHIIPLADFKKEGVVETLHKLMEEVYALVLSYGGSISAEHNDGLLRTPYLSKMFRPNIIELFNKTKEIFDPKNILNPRKKVHGNLEFSWAHVDRG